MLKFILYICLALTVLGVFALLGITPKNMISDFDKLISYINTIYRERQSTKHISLKKKVELASGKKKVNFFVKNFIDAENILSANKRRRNMKKVYAISAVGVLAAIFISFMLGNVFILPPLAVGLALMPAWTVKLLESAFIRNINDELETALSCITSSYMRTDNLVLAVEENLDIINPPVLQTFLTFYNENRLINSNVTYGINKIKGSFENTILSEWCDALIQCQDDRSLKATLYPIVRKFSEVKRVQSELDTMMMLPMQNFIIMTVTLLLMIPVLASIQPGWFDILVNTLGGKILLSLTIVVVIFGIDKAIGLSKPIEYKGR